MTKQRAQPFFSKPLLVPPPLSVPKRTLTSSLSSRNRHQQWQKHTSVIKELGNKPQQQNTKKIGISKLGFAIRHYYNTRSGIPHSLSFTYLSFPWHIHSSANCFLSWMLRDRPSPVVPFTVSTQQNTTHWLRPHLHTLVSLKTRNNIFELGRVIQISLLCQHIIHSSLGMSPYEGTLFYPSRNGVWAKPDALSTSCTLSTGEYKWSGWSDKTDQ